MSQNEQQNNTDKYARTTIHSMTGKNIWQVSEKRAAIQNKDLFVPGNKYTKVRTTKSQQIKDLKLVSKIKEKYDKKLEIESTID